MRSVRLSKALVKGKVFVRNAKTGQIMLKFRSPGVTDRILPPYALAESNSRESFTNLSQIYSVEQLKTSNLEDLILRGDLELLALAAE